MLPFKYSRIGTPVGSLVDVIVDFRQAALIDLDTMEEIIPFGRYRWIDTSPYGLAVLRDMNHENGVSLVSMDSWETIIPFGIYDGIRILSSDTIRVEERTRQAYGFSAQAGILNIPNGRVIIPMGELTLSYHMFSYSSGLIILREGNFQRATLIDATTGETLIPFRVYRNMGFWSDSHIVVRDGDIHRLEPIPR